MFKFIQKIIFKSFLQLSDLQSWVFNASVQTKQTNLRTLTFYHNTVHVHLHSCSTHLVIPYKYVYVYLCSLFQIAFQFHETIKTCGQIFQHGLSLSSTLVGSFRLTELCVCILKLINSKLYIKEVVIIT